MTLQELFDMSKPDVYVRVSNGNWTKLVDNVELDSLKADVSEVTLWEGAWSSGSLVVEGIEDYEFVKVKASFAGLYSDMEIVCNKNYFSSNVYLNGAISRISDKNSKINPNGYSNCILTIELDEASSTISMQEVSVGLSSGAAFVFVNNASFKQVGFATAVTKIVGVKKQEV